MRIRFAIFLVVFLMSAKASGQGLSPGTMDTVSPIVRSWHFPTVNVAPANSAGTELSVASAAPPAISMGIGFGQPFFIIPSANTTLVGEHGIYGAGAISNYAQRASFESFTVDDPNGWTVTETAGDGSAVITEESTIVAHRSSSVKMVLTGTTSLANVRSACITCTADTCDYDLFGSAWIKKDSGTTVTTIRVQEYDANDCTTFLQNNDSILASSDVTTSWVKYDGLVAAASFHANTSSVKMLLVEAGDGGVTTYFDAAQLRIASTPTDAYCATDADATAVCNLNDITDDAPPAHMTGTWEFEATIQSPIDGAVGGTPHRRVFYVPGTAGNNNRILLYWSSDTLTCTVHDSAGVAKTSTVAAAGNADTSYVVKMSKSIAGVVQCCWDGTCDATPATGAIVDGVGAELIFGGNGTSGNEVWVQEPVIRRVETP